MVTEIPSRILGYYQRSLSSGALCTVAKPHSFENRFVTYLRNRRYRSIELRIVKLNLRPEAGLGHLLPHAINQDQTIRRDEDKPSPVCCLTIMVYGVGRNILRNGQLGDDFME